MDYNFYIYIFALTESYSHNIKSFYTVTDTFENWYYADLCVSVICQKRSMAER